MLRILVCGYLLAATSASLFAQHADTIYHGGVVVTIDDSKPIAEAVAVRDGRIVAVGNKQDVLKLSSEKTVLVDLRGRALLPGFIDAHGHLMNVGVQAAVANLLPTPDGKVDSIDNLLIELKRWADSEAAKKILNGKLIIGLGYDDTQLKEKRHPTRHELDTISSKVAVVAIHQSGHMAVLNSKALEVAGITSASENPRGGVIVREQDGVTPAGLIDETAWFPVLFDKILPAISPGNERYFIEQGQISYLKFGFTTGQEGRATLANLIALADANLSGLLKIDVVAYPDPLMVKDVFAVDGYGPDYKGRFRVGGIKLTLDGSAQGKTMWLTKPYKVPPLGQGIDFRGVPSMKDEDVSFWVKEAVERKWQVLCHCNGDAAADQFLAAINQAGTISEVKSTRPVMIHAQTVREDQLDLMSEYGVIPSFFSMHTYYWGDWHRSETLGDERAMRISPAASAISRQMPFTAHHDAPVALADSIRIISSSVSRRSRGGMVMGKEQKISMLDALKSLTLHAAYQYGEEARKGSIEVGKLADFVVLSANPLAIEEDRIMELKVMETIKEGETVFRATSSED
jgi:predicted amidohydrolase YtcJ